MKTFNSQLGVVDAGFNSNGSMLAFTSMDYTLKVVNMQELTEHTNMGCNPMEAWKVRFWGDKVVTAGDQGKIQVKDPLSGDQVNDFRFKDAFVTGIAVNGKNDLVFANCKGGLGVYHEDNVTELETEHQKYIRAIKFGHDGNKVFMASDDLRVTLFDL